MEEKKRNRNTSAPELSTLCYIRRNDSYLMLHRVSKEGDVNKDKWIGVGGHFEEGESPEECLVREVREETGLTLTHWRFCGIVTFVLRTDAREITEYMHLFTADAAREGLDGTLPPCDEGVLEWVPVERVEQLNLWEGDRIFLRLIAEEHPFFSLKLIYGEGGRLLEAVLDGMPVACKNAV